MAQKQDITNLTTLLFSFMNQPDPMPQHAGMAVQSDDGS